MFPTREQWLLACANDGIRPLISAQGHTLPQFRVTCGFPRGRKAIGQCWYSDSSADQTNELMISPVLADPLDVSATLAHELCHAALTKGIGHKAPFKHLAYAIGLEGKPTATVPGELFKRTIEPILIQLGPYPHARLDPGTLGKKQTTRLIKASCIACGYTVRVTRQWLAQAIPQCPIHLADMEVS